MPERSPLYPPPPALLPGRGASEVSVPAAAVVDERLPLQRALRPLHRGVPSRRALVLDERAAARLIADQPSRTRAWAPVMRSVPERWLDATLVVDTSDSMRVWRPAERELHGLLVESGVFRDVTSWRLEATRGGGAAIVSASRRRTLRSPAELVDPTARRVIFVLSDCAGPAWYSGAAGAVLRRWATHGPVAILQPLPERMWANTALPTVAGTVSAPRPCSPNASLRFVPFDGLAHPATAVPVPVLEISKPWVDRWARIVADGVPEVCAAAFLTGRTRPYDPVAETVEVAEPLHRVLRFRAVASPEAVRLAGYLAIAPLDLPVMRHVHRAMLRPCRTAHLAEVLLSGLLVVRDSEPGRYAFVQPEIAGLLLDTLPVASFATSPISSNGCRPASSPGWAGRATRSPASWPTPTGTWRSPRTRSRTPTSHRRRATPPDARSPGGAGGAGRRGGAHGCRWRDGARGRGRRGARGRRWRGRAGPGSRARRRRRTGRRRRHATRVAPRTEGPGGGDRGRRRPGRPGHPGGIGLHPRGAVDPDVSRPTGPSPSLWIVGADGQAFTARLLATSGAHPAGLEVIDPSWPAERWIR